MADKNINEVAECYFDELVGSHPDPDPWFPGAKDQGCTADGLRSTEYSTVLRPGQRRRLMYGFPIRAMKIRASLERWLHSSQCFKHRCTAAVRSVVERVDEAVAGK